MKLMLASAILAGLARLSSGIHVWYNAKGHVDNQYSCGDRWTDEGSDGPKTPSTSPILREDCESLAGSLSTGSGFWNIDHWSIDDSRDWLLLKGNGTCHFAVNLNESQLVMGDDTVYIAYQDISSVLIALMTTKSFGADSSYFSQISGSWASCQPNNIAMQWALYNPFISNDPLPD